MVSKDIEKFVKDGEAAEPIDGEHYIIQPTGGYRFGSDAVSLYKYAAGFLHKGDRVFELCSGCGIIGISLAIETKCKLVGMEIDGALCDMSNRSCALNDLADINFINADIKNVQAHAERSAFDAVVCNPPFYKAGSAPRKVAPAANSELSVTLSDVVSAADYLLRFGGAFYVVHTASRLDEVLCALRAAKLTPKELVVNTNGKTFLLKALKGGNDGMTVRVR